MIRKKVGALLNMALSLLRHSVVVFLRKRRGLDIITREFLADGVLPVRAAERARAPQFVACTGCGLCDVLTVADDAPSLLIPRLGREAGDAVLALATAASLRPMAEAVSAMCPEKVDVVGLIDRVTGQAASLGGVGA
jgi:hypothetical protein